MAHSINANPVPKLYRSIIEDVIENVAEIFTEEGIDEQILKELKQLWESKVMQSKATEGFFRDHRSSTQFVLQLPQNLHQALQTSTASLVIPGGRNVQNFTSSGLSSSRSSTTFTLPPGISYPIHVPAGVTLQTASGHLYKVNVPVMVTQTPSGPRILQHQQLFQHLGPSSFQTAVSQLKTASEIGPQRSQLQKSVTQLCNESQALQQKQIGKDIALEPPVLDPPRQYVDNQQHILIDENHNQKTNALTEQSSSDPLQALSMQKHTEFDFIDQAETGKTDLTATSQSVQEHFLKEPTNLAQHQVPDDTIELLLLDDGLDESESLTKQSNCSLSEEVPTFGSKTKVHNNFEIIQIDGTGDTSSDEEMGTVHDVEENEFLGIIDTEDLKALEEDDSGSNEDSTSNSSDDEEPEIDAIEEDPLNSGDDVSEQEVPDLFDTDNVIVCQYDKIHRSKNKWKFYLKDGVMSFGGKDYVFSKAIGEAEW